MFALDLTPEQQHLRDLARSLSRTELIPVAARYDANETFPDDFCRAAWGLGLATLNIPKAFGGAGLGVFDSILMLDEISYGCAGISSPIGSNIFAATPLVLAGNDAQKREYLGWLVRECSFAALGLAGVDAGIRDGHPPITYRRAGNERIINGTQAFVWNGGVANWFTVFAADAQRPDDGLSCFVLRSDLQGVRRTPVRNKFGRRAADVAQVRFEEVVIRNDALVGDEHHAREIAAATLDRLRVLGAAMSLGIARRALDEASAYALERKQFGQPIANFQAIQSMLADMKIAIEAARLLTYQAGWSIDHGRPASVAASCAASFTTDTAMRVTTDAVQIFGGYGYMKDFPVEKLMRDAKASHIPGDSPQTQRALVARHVLAAFT
ncbi:MAG TPA: acyl-CoA dehydrogenase family protein [Candidatus Binatia bacterium]|nr:acyl-CoA dehydrogenase family protein [Candidatus Binatia bacterium]